VCYVTFVSFITLSLGFLPGVSDFGSFLVAWTFGSGGLALSRSVFKFWVFEVRVSPAIPARS
jgi:hypothetical protein